MCECVFSGKGREGRVKVGLREEERRNPTPAPFSVNLPFSRGSPEVRERGACTL